MVQGLCDPLKDNCCKEVRFQLLQGIDKLKKEKDEKKNPNKQKMIQTKSFGITS